jgi:hypothetical protein
MVKFKSHLWDKLKSVAAAARKKYPLDREAWRYHAGLGCLGLIFESRPRHGGYWCTPTNSLSFAWNGGGGTHFSFLVKDNVVHDRSPIICTVPEPGDQQNFIVGKNLNQFLSLGYYCGYFGLEQLAFDLDGTLQAFTRSNRKQNLKTDIWAERSADPERAAVLQFLQKQMGLQPWDGGKREFKSLQRSFMSRLEYSAEAKKLLCR